MICWAPFVHESTDYDLSHLHPLEHSFEQAAQGSKPGRSYQVQVIFSLHCFTRMAGKNDNPMGPLGYADSRETRIFDFGRYEKSKQLPGIVRSLPELPCFHTGRRNFFTERRFNAITGQEEDYEIFFTVSRSSSKAVPLNLFVQSAYVRDSEHPNKPSRKKIGFFTLLHNVMQGKVVKVPP